MKTGISILLLIIVAAFSHDSHAREVPVEIQRWDLMMIEEAPIWKNLLNSYIYADHAKFWPERKAALQTVITEYPDSQWADDAALILACGKYEFEQDLEGSIRALKDIGSAYPDGKTVVSVIWPIGGGCKFDEVWLMSQGSLVFLNPDKTVRTTKPFDRHGEIYQNDREVLTYFEHLLNYPRSTKTTAGVFLSQILIREGGNIQGAISELKEITTSSRNYLSTVARVDAAASSGPHGYHIRALVRPEQEAYFRLIGLHEHQGESDKAIAKADEFATYANSGQHWGIMRRLGDFYEGRDLKQKAKTQYQFALGIIKNYIKADKERSKHLEYITPPTEQELSPHLKQEAVNLERRIAETGL